MTELLVINARTPEERLVSRVWIASGQHRPRKNANEGQAKHISIRDGMKVRYDGGSQSKCTSNLDVNMPRLT
jgi:hypothetical protein